MSDGGDNGTHVADKSHTDHTVNTPDALQVETGDVSSSGKANTTALNGLRGIMAVYIMVFHSLLYSKLQLNILGSVIMPFFFLISGFVLALNYGKKTYSPTVCCTELSGDPEDESRFDGKNFYQRRIARTLPLYYLTNLLVIPLTVVGHSWSSWWFVWVMVVFVTGTWLGIPMVMNGPSWFVSTIWFFYWIFPSLLPRLQLYTSQQKQRWILYHYIIQLVGAVALAFLFEIYVYGGFYWATFWPVSRLPLFIMGVLGGLLRNESLGMRRGQNTWTQQQWSRCSNILGALIALFFVGGSLLTNLWMDIGLNLFAQLVIAWWALEFIISLSFDDGTSFVSKVLSGKVTLYLGQLSYSLYLVHEVLIQYLCWINYGAIEEPDCECNDSKGGPCCDDWDEYREKRLMPNWCIPILYVVSFILALVLNRLVEEPLRKKLRPKQKEKEENGEKEKDSKDAHGGGTENTNGTMI